MSHALDRGQAFCHNRPLGILWRSTRGGVQYFIDGYNVLHRMQKLDTHNLQVARETLRTRLMLFCEGKHRIRLVWDSGDRDPRVGSIKRFRAVYEVYAQNADEYLVQSVRREAKGQTITVVTNDREIIGRCKKLGAVTMSSDDFLALLDDEGDDFPGYPGEPWEKYFP
ncbi:MAG: NYN domain-containing protein [Planctomycetota bacterium]